MENYSNNIDSNIIDNNAIIDNNQNSYPVNLPHLNDPTNITDQYSHSNSIRQDSIHFNQYVDYILQNSSGGSDVIYQDMIDGNNNNYIRQNNPIDQNNTVISMGTVNNYGFVTGPSGFINNDYNGLVTPVPVNTNTMDINHLNNAFDNNGQNDLFNQRNSISNRRDQQLVYIISLLQNIQNIVNQLLNNHNN